MTFKRLLLVFVLILPSFAFADLDDFKEGIEREERENQEKDTKEDENQEDGDGSLSSGFLELFAEMFRAFWYLNRAVYYSSYPFSEDEYNFIAYEYIPETAYDSGLRYSDRMKRSWFHLYAGGLGIPDGGGGYAGFYGRFFSMLGYDAEYRVYFDGDDVLHTVFAGTSVSLFQFNPFSVNLYSRFVHFGGLLDRNGIEFGAMYDSFPVRPLSFRLQTGIIVFEYVSLFHVDVRTAFHINRWELFLRYNSMSSEYSNLWSFGGGAGIYF